MLTGLGPEGARLARRLLDEFDGWDGANLQTLAAYCGSCERLSRLQADPAADPRAVHREARINLLLLRALDLERC